MNLETFKARARRKLELSARPSTPFVSSQRAPDPAGKHGDNAGQSGPASDDTTSLKNQPAQDRTNEAPPFKAPARPAQSAPGSADRFAAVMNYAAAKDSDTTAGPATASLESPAPANSRRDQLAPSGQTGADPDTVRSINKPPVAKPQSSDDQLAHLRSLLLGNEYESRQGQLNAVDRRTQSGLNTLQRDMDRRLTDLAEQVEQLEHSFSAMQTKISEQLSSQSSNALGNTESMTELRDALRAHTESIQAELRAQTKQQGAQLASHRADMETQFNSAIAGLISSTVSHKELSQLLSRLADRIKQL